MQVQVANPAVIHRDLKTTNILIDGRGQPRICDFGLARCKSPPERGQPQRLPPGATITGTPGYMPPEYAASGQTPALLCLSSVAWVTNDCWACCMCAALGLHHCNKKLWRQHVMKACHMVPRHAASCLAWLRAVSAVALTSVQCAALSLASV